MKKYNQSAAIEKRERLITEREKQAKSIINSIVKKALSKQKKTYFIIIGVSSFISFVIGVLTRFIQ